MTYDVEKMSAKELIKLVDDVLDEKFGRTECSFRVTMPSGKVVVIEVGREWEFWEEFKKDIGVENDIYCD